MGREGAVTGPRRRHHQTTRGWRWRRTRWRSWWKRIWGRPCSISKARGSASCPSPSPPPSPAPPLILGTPLLPPPTTSAQPTTTRYLTAPLPRVCRHWLSNQPRLAVTAAENPLIKTPRPFPNLDSRANGNGDVVLLWGR